MVEIVHRSCPRVQYNNFPFEIWICKNCSDAQVSSGEGLRHCWRRRRVSSDPSHNLTYPTVSQVLVYRHVPVRQSHQTDHQSHRDRRQRYCIIVRQSIRYLPQSVNDQWRHKGYHNYRLTLSHRLRRPALNHHVHGLPNGVSYRTRSARMQVYRIPVQSPTDYISRSSHSMVGVHWVRVDDDDETITSPIEFAGSGFFVRKFEFWIPAGKRR